MIKPAVTFKGVDTRICYPMIIHKIAYVGTMRHNYYDLHERELAYDHKTNSITDKSIPVPIEM